MKTSLFIYIIFLFLFYAFILYIRYIDMVNDININNQRYLEICEEFKIILEDKNKELKSIKIKYNNLYKNLIICFGIMRLIKEEIDFSENFELDSLIHKLDYLLNNYLFSHLYKIEED